MPCATLTLVVDYATVTPLQRLWDEYEVSILEEEFAVDVTYTLQLPLEHIDTFSATVTNLTNGQALIEVAESEEEGWNPD